MASEDTVSDTKSVRLRSSVVDKLHRLKKQLDMSSINDVVVLLLSHYEKCMSKRGEGHVPGSGQ